MEIPKKLVPKDKDGYLIAFDVEEEEKIKNFFDEFGFVVIQNCCSKEDCEKTIDEIWEVQNSMAPANVVVFYYFFPRNQFTRILTSTIETMKRLGRDTGLVSRVKESVAEIPWSPRNLC